MQLLSRIKLFESFSKIKKLTKKEIIFKTNKNGTIYISGFKIDSLEDLDLPEECKGAFYCNNIGLTTLKGSPKKINGEFSCENNKLKNLLGGPEHVNNWFDCSSNLLISLEGAPKYVDGLFICSENPNLSKEEILKYKLTGAVKNKIISDFGEF